MIFDDLFEASDVCFFVTKRGSRIRTYAKGESAEIISLGLEGLRATEVRLFNNRGAEAILLSTASALARSAQEGRQSHERQEGDRRMCDRGTSDSVRRSGQSVVV